MAEYHRNAKTNLEVIRLILSEPNFFNNIRRNWLKLNDNSKDDKLLRISLEDWNNHTLEVFHEILDFLEYPKENRLFLAPVKFTSKQRNFEGYSCSHIPKNQKVSPRLEVIRSG
jgi:hypothetical protein